jgi:hypothetical protein
MFRAHVAKYPDSPWAAEAVLHCGCDALYHGRYREADRDFQSIINSFQGNTHPGAQMMAHKARLRLANLRTAQGNFLEAMNQYAILKKSSPDWRHRTYAAAWILTLSQWKQQQEAVVNCGIQALARLLEMHGNKAAANDGFLPPGPKHAGNQKSCRRLRLPAYRIKALSGPAQSYSIAGHCADRWPN